jgi:hypothetical protein
VKLDKKIKEPSMSLPGRIRRTFERRAKEEAMDDVLKGDLMMAPQLHPKEVGKMTWAMGCGVKNTITTDVLDCSSDQKDDVEMPVRDQKDVQFVENTN